MNTNSSDLSTTIASWTRKLSLSVLLVGCLCSPSWGQVKTAEIVGKPSVQDDSVKLRIKVTDTNDRPVTELQKTDFSLVVDAEPVTLSQKDYWKSSQETTPPPTWIVVLLDYSGSMQQLDSRGTTKLEGAVKAIKQFTTAIAQRGPNTQVAIVPFGDPGSNCAGNPVNKENLDKFFPASDFKLINYLDFLASQSPCASTNLYEPLTQAVRFLGNQEDTRFYVPEDSQQPEPKLAVVLLSDGYHNKPNEKQDFDKLISLLKDNKRITVHTLGYGLTAQQLGQKYNLGHAASRKDIGISSNEVPKVPEEEFVDEQRLKQIAKVTGGIGEFSPDAETVTEKLKVFLNALLGEYEITYIQPNAERGSKHQISVKVQSVASKSQPYTITVFGRSLPLQARLLMLLIVLVAMGAGGAVPFWLWAKHLKREAQEA